MRDNLSIIITMLVFVVLIIIFPLYNYFERQDDMSYNLVLKATTNFVDSVINSGYIDQEMYDKFIQELAVTGNLYDIQLEAHKKTYTKDPYNTESDTYVEQYIIDYNADIFNEETGETKNSNIKIDNKVLKNGAYYLNIGDQIYVKLKNSSTTMAGAIFNVIVPTSDTKRLAVNYGGIVKNNAWKNQDISNLFQKDIYINMLLDITNTPGLGNADKIEGMPTYALDESSQIRFNVKVINYEASVAGEITDILKNNLKLTGFENKGTIKPKTVAKKASIDEWIVTFDLGDITDIDPLFGAAQYKTCELELDADLIQGNYYKNSAVKSDTIVVKKTNSD